MLILTHFYLVHIIIILIFVAQQSALRTPQRSGSIFVWRYHAVAANLLTAHVAKHPPHTSDALRDGNLVTADQSARWAKIQFDLSSALLSRCKRPVRSGLQKKMKAAAGLEGHNGMEHTKATPPHWERRSVDSNRHQFGPRKYPSAPSLLAAPGSSLFSSMAPQTNCL